MLVTKSNVSDEALRGPDIATVTARTTATKQTPVVVQINLKEDETEQGFIFPIQQCSSFLVRKLCTGSKPLVDKGAF
jgi:hypothetical protein